MNRLLLRTPKPHVLESFRGYLLRLAETNGLSSPSPILKLAGVTEGRMRCAEQPVEVLSMVTGHDVKLLAHLPLTHPISRIQQVSGHALSKGYSIVTKPKICPCCIKEQGYAPAYWDLIAVQGCYKHQHTLVSVCRVCEAELSWNRPGLLTCECGADLSELTGDPMGQEELEFLRIIDAKFNGLLLEDSVSIKGLPFKHLTEITLSTILAIVHTMGSMHLLIDNKVVRAKACTNKDEVKYALEILKDWPNNFFKFLHRVGVQHGRNSLGLDRQFSFFTQRFFKRGYPQHEIKFLKEAFIEFGQKHWGQAFFYSKMQTNIDVADKSNFVGVTYFAKAMGVTLTAVRTMIRDGRLVTKTLSGTKIDKKIIDLEKSNVKFPQMNNTIGAREAGKYIGLPAPVLKKLRGLGLYKSEHMTVKAGSFCIEDLESFKQRILNCQQSNIPKDQLISIEAVMRKSHRSLGLKATIIEHILNQTLTCFGSVKEIEQIQVKVSDLESMVDNILLVDRGWLTVKQTSIALKCDSGIIITMLSSGLLEGLNQQGVHQIKKESVYAFSERYVALRQLALSFNLGVKALITLCSQNRFGVLSVKRKFNGNQTFMEKADVKALANHVREYYLNHKKLAYRCRLETVNFSWVV